MPSNCPWTPSGENASSPLEKNLTQFMKMLPGWTFSRGPGGWLCAGRAVTGLPVHVPPATCNVSIEAAGTHEWRTWEALQDVGTTARKINH